MKRKYMFCALFSVIFCFFAFANKPVSAAETTYKIGTDLTFAPFEFQNEKNEYVGIDPVLQRRDATRPVDINRKNP